MSLLAQGRENDLRTSCYSRWLSSVPARNSSRSLRLGVAVVGVQNEWLLKVLADAHADSGPAHLIGCDGCVLALGEIAGDDLAVPDIYHQVEVEPDPPNGGGQVSDVPTPDLTWTYCPEPWHRSGFLLWPCSNLSVVLAVGLQNPVEAAL